VLDFRDITRRLKALELGGFDIVVGIGSGGIVPASLVAFHLNLPLRLLSINFRDQENRPQRPAPELQASFDPPPPGSRVLLVDDVSVSGATMAEAKRLLSGLEVTTLVFKGRGDHVLLPEVGQCVVWPWKRDD